MQNEFYETWNTLTQQTLENLKKLGEANLKLSEKLMREQIELTNQLVATTTASAQEVAGTKDVKQFATLQAELAQECGKKVLASSRTCADIVAEAGKVYGQLFENGVKTAADNAQKVQQKAQQKAA